MRLWDRLIRRDGGYWEGMASGAAILTTTYGSPDREAILPHLTAFAQRANAGASPVFSAILLRMMLLGEAQFQFQAKDDKHLYGNQSLAVLEHPWGPDSTAGELIARMEQDGSLAGNSYTWAPPGEDVLVRLRPDWVTIVSELVPIAGGGSYRRKVGYWHQPPAAVTGEGAGFMVPAAEVAHWHPIPDPQASFRGMSWLMPVMRDIEGDDAMAQFKIRYLQANATPNLVIKYAQKLQPGTVDAIRERMTARYGGPSNAGKTLVLDQGADLVAVGNSLTQIDFTNVSQLGIERILAAGGVPSMLVGLESAKGAGKSYEQIISRFADLTLRPLWRSMCAALEPLVPGLPTGSRLWTNTADIAALQDGEQVKAQVALVRAQALLTLVQAGFTGESAVTAVDSGDITLLEPNPGAAEVPAGPTPVQHLLPQAQPGATADPLPSALPRLPTGPVSPGDGGDSTRPTPRPQLPRGGHSKARTAVADTDPKATERLHEYWVHGPGAAKIAWGSPGDFDRCVAELGKYIDDPQGYCNLAHKAATGMYPAQHAAMEKKATGRSTVTTTTTQRAQMATSDINDLDDSDFAYIAPGGVKDASGKTVPRSNRFLPIHDKSHVANALARLPQTDIPAAAKASALTKIKAQAKKFGVGVSDDSGDSSGNGGSSRAEFMRIYSLEDIHIIRSEQGGDGRVVEAYAAVFGQEAEIHDHEGHYIEVIEPTAFNRAIDHASRARGGFASSVKVLWNHGRDLSGNPSDRFSMPIGVPVHIAAETRGVLTRTRYSETPLADEVLENIRNGSITAQSFVGPIMRSDPQLRRGDQHRPGSDGRLRTVRRTELGLRDYGPVLWPAYSGAEILGVRMSTPGADPDPDENDQALPPDEEPAPGDPLATDEHSARYHQHALYALRSKELREKAGLTW